MHKYGVVIMSQSKSLAKLGVIYAIGQVLSKALSFILLPIYTRQLGTVGYGQLAIADTVLDFIGAFVICGVYSGYYRFYREYDENQRRKLKNTAINFALTLAVFDIILVLIIGRPIAKLIFGFNNEYKILVLVVLRGVIVQISTLLMCDYTLNYKAVITVTTNLVNLVMNMCFSIFLVVYLKQGIVGVYKGYIYSNLIILIYLVIINIKAYRLEFDKGMLKNMLTFSAGYIPASLASTVLTLSDRYFLAGYRGYSETGIYSIGYKFGTLIEPIFITPFKAAFTPYKFQVWKDDDAQCKLNNMFIKYHFIGCFIILIISFYCKSVIFIFTTNAYSDVYKLVPLILLSYFLYEQNSFYSLGIEIQNKTYLESFILISGGIINIILNILFIPKCGMYGAAVATIVSYIIINIMYILYAMPMYYIRYNFKDSIKFYPIITILYLSYYFISIKSINLFLESVISFILLGIYIYLCIALKLVEKEDILLYFNKIKQKINFKLNRGI